MNRDPKPWQKHYDPGVSTHLNYPPITLPDILKSASLAFPEQDCIIHENRKYSYRKVDENSSILAKTLNNIGVIKGDRVGMVFPNSPEFVIAFFAILKAGGVVVAINPNYKVPEIQYIIEDSGLKAVLVGRAQSTLETKLREIPQVEFVVQYVIEQFSDSTIIPDEETIPSDSKRNSITIKVEDYGLPIIGMDDPAVFQYSGGTTGVPKGAVGLHKNLVANVYQFSEWLKYLSNEKPLFLSAIPFYHVYGMVLALCLPIKMQSPMITIENIQETHLLIDLINEHKPDVFPCVPTLFRALMKSADFERIQRGSVKICISGSAPLQQEIKEEFELKSGASILEGYGLSEAPTATHCNPLIGKHKDNSIGLPLPDVDCRIVDMETGKHEMPLGETGELIIRGPQVMRGYHNKRNEMKGAIRNGWLFTGDIATMDSDGYFFITGRKKDLIKVSGFQVWPGEVEAVIRRYPGVSDVVVAGVDDEVTGERPKAWIIVGPPFELNHADVRRFCKKFLADYKVPKEIEAVLEFPRSSIGKVLRRELIRLDYIKKHPG
jgi:long-chain acyl-CoA synthetase